MLIVETIKKVRLALEKGESQRSVALNADYAMGSGRDPFWIQPGNAMERILSWFFNVPSGWLILIGSGPFLIEVLQESIEKLRFGIERDIFLPVLKVVGAALALLFLLFVVLGV